MSESGKILGESMPNFNKQVARERIRQTTTYGLENARNRQAENKWGGKISSFGGEIDYGRTDDPKYMAQVANDTLKHFGFKGNARVSVDTKPGYTDYALIVDADRIVAGYRQYGSDSRKIGMNLRDMVESALLYKMSKNGGESSVSDLVDATGSIRGMNWKFKR